MGKIILYVLLASTGVSAVFRPWVGVIASYVFVILCPQAIWWWNFENIRPVYWIMLPTLAGTILSLARGDLNLTSLWNKRNFWIFVLWCCFTLSYFLGPYTEVINERRSFDPWSILMLINNIFILYFTACVCINDEKKLKILASVMAFSTIYLIYWINAQYLFGGLFGRIGGPTGQFGGTVYQDENAFAMFFVTGLPFLYYGGLALKNKLYRYGMWLAIPFGWHAIFLTGSRGGLVGLGVIILMMAIRARTTIIRVLIIPVFICIFFWQAGPVMINRAETISEFQTEASAATRLQAWSAAINMVSHYPFTGVGLASFIPAFPDYSNFTPREAHNTFLQISAETGVLGGLSYIMIFLLTILSIIKNNKILKGRNQHFGSDQQSFFALVNEAVFASFIGIITCSFFLSLHVYEIFYFLCLLNNINTVLILQGSQLVES